MCMLCYSMHLITVLVTYHVHIYTLYISAFDSLVPSSSYENVIILYS